MYVCNFLQNYNHQPCTWQPGEESCRNVMTNFDSSVFLVLWRKFATCIDNRKFVP